MFYYLFSWLLIKVCSSCDWRFLNWWSHKVILTWLVVVALIHKSSLVKCWSSLNIKCDAGREWVSRSYLDSWTRSKEHTLSSDLVRGEMSALSVSSGRVQNLFICRPEAEGRKTPRHIEELGVWDLLPASMMTWNRDPSAGNTKVIMKKNGLFLHSSCSFPFDSPLLGSIHSVMREITTDEDKSTIITYYIVK